jgi:hypothetical protein
MINQPSYIKSVFESLPLDIWFDILSLLDIQDARSISIADPRSFGAFIEDKQVIRFRNAFNTAPPPPFLRALYISAAGYSSFSYWLQRRLLRTCIVPPNKLFVDISARIALKESGFVTTSSSLSDWDVKLKGEDGGVCSFSWKLLYRGSLLGFHVREFHYACDGVGKYVVVVRAENGRIAVAYNEDGFNSDYSQTANVNGFIVSIEEDGSCGAQFDRNDREEIGILNHPNVGPYFWIDLSISDDCDKFALSCSWLGDAYGEGPEINESTLFGKVEFRVSDYEVFKILRLI